MKKILSRIFSVTLALATVATPMMAQTAKKAKAANQNAKAIATLKAEKAPAAKADKGFNVLPTKKAASPFASAKKSPAKTGKSSYAKIAKEAPADMPTIYGDIIYNDLLASGDAETGLYELPKNGTSNANFLFATASANYGGVCVDEVYYVSNYETIFGFLLGMEVIGYDMESGEQVFYYDAIETSDYSILNPAGYAVDPTSNIVYAVGYDAAVSSASTLKTAVFGNNTVTYTEIANLGGNWNSIAFDSTGQLYGISYVGTTDSEGNFTPTASYLNKINKTTGEVTQIGETGMLPMYLSDCVIDTKTNKMYWNVCPPDETGLMCEVDLQTGAATVLYELKNADEIVGMFIPAPAAEDGAPAECSNVNVVFDGSSLTGVVTLKAPATLFDGSAATGNVNIKVLVNGEQVATTSVAYGADASLNVTLAEAGLYTFTVVASNSVGDGPKTNIKNIWVGADTPEATSASLAYVNGNMEVTWNAVTGSVNGGYLDLDNLTYTVKRNDGTVAAEGLTTTTFTEAVAEPENLTEYYYTVEVVCGDLTSAPAKTNVVVLGAIVPPYTSDFGGTGLQGWTIIDANGDGKIWTVYGGNIRMQYNSSADMDDWLITPPIKLEAGKAYNVSFEAWAQGASFPERLEVKYGKVPTAAGLDKTLIASTDITGTDHIPFDEMLAPEEDGTYYIGFHGISDADMFYLNLSNITIEAGVSALAPGLATNLVVTPGEGGALTANIVFNAPDKTMNNQTLSSLTKVEILRGETVVKTFDNPTPGAALSYDDVLTTGGDVTYTVIGYNEEGAGLKATASAFIGFDVPVAPAEATIERTANVGEVVVTWSAVTEDVNGQTLGASDVTYILCEYDNGWVPFVEGLTTTSYSYQAVEAGEQDFVQVAVFAQTTAGAGSGVATGMIPVGTPYDGIDESFADGTLSYIWGLSAISGGTVNICSDSQFTDMTSCDGDNGFIGIYSNYLDGGADFFSGLVSLEGLVNPGLSFYTYNIHNEAGEPDINEITVSIKGIDDEDWTPVLTNTVEELCNGLDGWSKVQVSLGAYANQTIQFQITGITKYYTYTMIDAIKVGSILGHDLKAKSITAPAHVKAGADYDVDVTVVNEGAQEADSYSVELYENEELVETEELSNLAPGAAEVVTFSRAMSALATEDVVYFAKVVYAADENETNNQTSSVTVSPIVSTLPVATDLKANENNGNVVLSWDAPNLSGPVAEYVTEDFEDAESFSAEYGNWTFADLDGSAVGGFQNMDVPGITVGSTTGSFWVWDHELLGNDTFAAHSGEKYLFALFRYDDGTTDDWAISPELSGNAQTVSFFARSYSSSYPEKIEVYYSTGSIEPADFVLVEGVGGTVPADWTEYSANIPAGAKHFAIRSCATGSFMLMVDDVTYETYGENGNLEIEGYNVYRDGVKINSELVTGTSYTDSNVEEGQQYTYVVTVVYKEKGESAGSEELVVNVMGVDGITDGALNIFAADNCVVVLNATGVNVTVASVNGAVVYTGAGEAKTIVETGAGVYVVKAGSVVKKVVVK